MKTNTLAYANDSLVMAQHEASRRSMETLMSCYCREVAKPQGQLNLGVLFGQNDWPQSIHMSIQSHGGSAMHVSLPMTDIRLMVVVAEDSTTGNYRYQSPFYCKEPAKHWTLLELEGLIAVLVNELAMQTGTTLNHELMQQINDSVAVTAAVLHAARPKPLAKEPLQAFIESEQSLIFGHPFHPAPKSRQGISYDDMLRYSPEMGAKFPLHYFAVRREYLQQQSVLPTACDQIILAQAPAGLDANNEFALIPTHPWQARYLLEHASVSGAIRDGRIRDLGPQGKDYYPTSSIRTLFQPDNPYFYKGSLNIRITNCVRKNAPYELEGALQVTRIMRDITPRLQQCFPGACVLEEPAFITVDLKQNDAQLDKEVSEGFGMILRTSFNDLLQPGATPLLAAALFGNHIYGAWRIQELLMQMRLSCSLTQEEAAEQWFSRYVAQVMYPVLYCFFEHGVVFEPHLQNVVIGVGQNGPQQVFLRDFEGVKLVSERFAAELLSDVSPRAREALWYSSELGWKRVVYCLFVNNFCEAIAQIGAGNSKLQQRLWSIVKHHLQHYLRQHGDVHSMQRITALLNGEPFPGKTNLLNRFFKRADRATTYLPVANPMGLLEGGQVWS